VSKTCAVSIPNNAVTLMQPAPADAHYLLHVIFNLDVRRQLGTTWPLACARAHAARR
jgi:hypothetical protein